MCDDDRLWAAISIGSLLCIRALSTRLLRNNMLNPTQTRKRHVFPFDCWWQCAKGPFWQDHKDHSGTGCWSGNITRLAGWRASDLTYESYPCKEKSKSESSGPPRHTERHDAYGTAPGKARLSKRNPSPPLKSHSPRPPKISVNFLRKGKRRCHFAEGGDWRVALTCLVYRMFVI
jgi:hypothetical protein